MPLEKETKGWRKGEARGRGWEGNQETQLRERERALPWKSWADASEIGLPCDVDSGPRTWLETEPSSLVCPVFIQGNGSTTCTKGTLITVLPWAP